jgi:acyl carrier protein phosphodiesterase
MENLPIDIQVMIYENVHKMELEEHKMQFSKCLQELPLKVYAFYFAINETVANDHGHRDKETVHIDELYDHYLYRAEEGIEELSNNTSISKEMIERLTNKPYECYEMNERAWNNPCYGQTKDDYILNEVIGDISHIMEETWNIGKLAFLLDQDYQKLEYQL